MANHGDVTGSRVSDRPAGPDAAPPVSRRVLGTLALGLDPRPTPRRDVVVIGGGLAGLVAAYELKRQGHRPMVLEAQNRVGGRIYRAARQIHEDTVPDATAG